MPSSAHSPAVAVLEKRDDIIIFAFRLEIHEQRRLALEP
jgi:hypothetical protein